MAKSATALKIQAIKLWSELKTIENLEENIAHKDVLRQLQYHMNSRILDLLRDSNTQIEYANDILAKVKGNNKKGE